MTSTATAASARPCPAGAGRARLPWVRRTDGRSREDRGAATTEIVIIFPPLFALILTIAQVAVWGHGLHVAQAVASHALAATRVEGGTAQAGRADAQHVLDQLGHGPLRDVHVDVDRGPENASVRVDGRTSSVVPFLYVPVHAEAAGPLEKFRPADQAAP
ncbi:TadE/TadG family type IV pilus assembly protein [Streptomyces sp. NPDC054796]